MLTSSNFSAIIEKALKIASVGPVMVTILSGQEPSEILIRAPLCQKEQTLFNFILPGEKSKQEQGYSLGRNILRHLIHSPTIVASTYIISA